MKNFDEIYKNVPSPQRERLKEFRSTHPYKSCDVDGVLWQYIFCGKGEKTLLLLPGGIHFAETWFKLITALEDEYRIISPSYPALPAMAEHIKGIYTICAAEGINKVHILGTSFGGWVAQCFVRHYPDMVEKVVFSHTSGPGGISTALLGIGQIMTQLTPERLLRRTFKRNYALLFSIPDQEREFWNAYLEELSLRTTKNDVLMQQECGRDFNAYKFSKDDLIDWPGTILLLESDDDPAFTPYMQKALKDLYPQAHVHTFHNAGHTPGYTNPEKYLLVVKSFLDESEPFKKG
jgi:pimeloyl-ACP methyl ester carboxylesterase